MSLQRRIMELEARQRESEQVIDELRVDNKRLTEQRQLLFQGEENERAVGEKRDKEFSEARLALEAKIKDLRSSNLNLTNDKAQLDSENRQLNAQYSQLQRNSGAELNLRDQRIKELEETCEGLRGWERRAKGLSIELEEERRKAKEGRREAEDERADSKEDHVMKQEFKRQSQYLSSLKENHSALQNEVVELRQKRKEYEANDRSARDIERKLRDEVKTLQDQLYRARQDMDSFTQTFASSSPSLSEVQQLNNRLNERNEVIAQKDTEINELHARLIQLSGDSQSSNTELAKQLAELRTECRWAKEGRAAAEQREELAKKEIKALRSIEERGSGSSGASGADQTERVRQLECLLDTYKTQVEEMDRDMREREEKLVEGAGFVKQSVLDETKEHNQKLAADIANLEATIAELTSANSTLDAEVNDLMRRVVSGEYNPERERCLELRLNPAAKIKAIRNEELEKLKKENEALLDKLSAGGGGAGGVPVESFERLRAEKEDLERSHAKRLQRLKEIFGTKSKEFLEAVYSLLGWRIKFDESGTDIRLTSMYAPKGKMGLTLKFASQEGHFGTMQMTGAMARGLEDTRHFWIVERQSVPGFLAQVTTEMFEKTTIGRAAGYVGLE